MYIFIYWAINFLDQPLYNCPNTIASFVCQNYICYPYDYNIILNYNCA